MTRSWGLSCRILSKVIICSDRHFQQEGQDWVFNQSSSGGDREVSSVLRREDFQDLVTCQMRGEGFTKRGEGRFVEKDEFSSALLLWGTHNVGLKRGAWTKVGDI